METLKDIGVVIALIASSWGLWKGVIEFNLQGKQKRAEMFLKKQSEYFGNKAFNEIRSLLEIDAVELRERSFEEKRAYLTFFEEIAILKNSKLLKADLTYYMYGYYATKCLESKNFWSNINQDEIFWSVFLGFSKEMQKRLRDNREVISHDIQA